MKIVILSKDCLVEGTPRLKGEMVQVPDGFDTKLIRKVINTSEQIAKSNKSLVKSLEIKNDQIK